jgi:hypothetical protein
MKQPRASRVPVVEDAFELNLPKLMRAAKATGMSRLVLDDGDVRTVVVLAETRLAAFLGGRTWLVDIVPVKCLNDRVRPLLKCPRAHEGNFQTLYWSGSEVACRTCLGLRYRSTLAATVTERARLARHKLLKQLGAQPGEVPVRQIGKWRRRHQRLIGRLRGLTATQYAAVLEWLDGVKKT